MYYIIFLYNSYNKKQYILYGLVQSKYSIGVTSKELLQNSPKTQCTLQETSNPVKFSSVQKSIINIPLCIHFVLFLRSLRNNNTGCKKLNNSVFNV